MAEVSISFSQKLKVKVDQKTLKDYMAQTLAKIYKMPVIVELSQLTMGQPDVSVIMSDFGNLTLDMAENLMDGAANSVLTVVPLDADDSVKVTIHATLVGEY